MWTNLSILSQTDSSTTWLFVMQVQLERVKMKKPHTLQRAGGGHLTPSTPLPQSPLVAGRCPARPTSALPCWPQLCPQGCWHILSWEGRDGAKLCPAPSLHRHSCTPGLRQHMNCLKGSEPFTVFLPCTIFDFKNFLYHLNLNLWVFN